MDLIWVLICYQVRGMCPAVPLKNQALLTEFRCRFPWFTWATDNAWECDRNSPWNQYCLTEDKMLMGRPCGGGCFELTKSQGDDDG